MFFISYSSRDSILAHQLRARLERDGLACWMAPEDIRAGQDYASEIPLKEPCGRKFPLYISAPWCYNAK